MYTYIHIHILEGTSETISQDISGAKYGDIMSVYYLDTYSQTSSATHANTDSSPWLMQGTSRPYSRRDSHYLPHLIGNHTAHTHTHADPKKNQPPTNHRVRFSKQHTQAFPRGPPHLVSTSWVKRRPSQLHPQIPLHHPRLAHLLPAHRALAQRPRLADLEPPFLDASSAYAVPARHDAHPRAAP